MEKIKVLIADDHPAYREGLCRFLESQEDLEVVAQATDGEESVSLAWKLRPDVAIIDIAMPGLSGIEAAKHIKEACPTTAILMLSAYDYESYVLTSLRAGAIGYLLKDVSLFELVDAVRMVHGGNAVFNLKATGDIFNRITADSILERSHHGRLHDRELQVLRLLAKGMSNKDIAIELTISERTIQTHLANIFEKLGVGSRTEAALHALKKGWLSLDDLP